MLGGFLALNLAGCGGGGGGIVTPTSIPGLTPAPAAGTIPFQLQLSDLTNATGGSITLSSASGRTYTANAGKNGVGTIRGVVPGTYTLVFSVVQPNGTSVTTTRSLVVTSGANTAVLLVTGQTGASNPFTVSGHILLNTDANGNPVASGVLCSSSSQPIISSVLVEVDDLNQTNGTLSIAQATITPDAAGFYSIKIPYQPRAFQVKVSTDPASTNGEVFAGLSASTSFPQSATAITADVCTNASTTPPLPTVTETPTSTPFATATTVGTPIATATSTSVAIATATTAPTATPTPTATTTGTPVATATSTTPTATATKTTTG